MAMLARCLLVSSLVFGWGITSLAQSDGGQRKGIPVEIFPWLCEKVELIGQGTGGHVSFSVVQAEEIRRPYVVGVPGSHEVFPPNGGKPFLMGDTEVRSYASRRLQKSCILCPVSTVEVIDYLGKPVTVKQLIEQAAAGKTVFLAFGPYELANEFKALVKKNFLLARVKHPPSKFKVTRQEALKDFGIPTHQAKGSSK